MSRFTLFMAVAMAVALVLPGGHIQDVGAGLCLALWAFIAGNEHGCGVRS